MIAPHRAGLPQLGVHATNITGLGAANLVGSLLPELLRLGTGRYAMTLYLGSSSSERMALPQEMYTGAVHYVRRRLPNSISRFLECLFPGNTVDRLDSLVVLGDLPLRTDVEQVVYVHQPHLISPRLDPNSSRRLRYAVARAVFRWNARCASWFVVQTEAMRANLVASYPAIEDKVVIIAAPPPVWLRPQSRRPRDRPAGSGRLRLFYPAAGYPHKNHRLLAGITPVSGTGWPIEQLVLTIPEAENPSPQTAWIKCVDRLDADACMQHYCDADALLFLSHSESYGLPLVEAMALGLPVICPDLPYARALCGSEAIYFRHDELASLQAAVRRLDEQLRQGWRPDWSMSLRSIPASWADVAERILALVHDAAARGTRSGGDPVRSI